MSESELSPAKVLRHLGDSGAFAQIQSNLVDKGLIELKIGDVCHQYLSELKSKKRHWESLQDIRSLYREQASSYARIARILWAIDPDPRDRFRFETKVAEVEAAKDRFGRLYPTNRAETARLHKKQLAMILNHLAIDLIAVLRHTTAMRLTDIQECFLPEVFGALGISFPDWMPQWALKAPRARAKRYLERALKVYKRMGVIVQRGQLLHLRAGTLFEADDRFPTDLFQPHQAQTTTSR